MGTKVDFFKNTFAFKNVDDERISSILSEVSFEERSYEKGDLIYSPDSIEKKIGFVKDGACVVVRKKMDGGIVPLNVINPYGSFGILSCFSVDDRFPTFIIAKKKCTVVFIKSLDFEQITKRHSDVAFNVIKFMAKKIGFLNSKISSFSGDNIEQKLSSYIFNRYKECGNTTVEFNKKKASEYMNVGRATLYRGLEKLVTMGLITLDSKIIIINDLEGLERISK